MNRMRTGRHLVNVASLLWLPCILACSSAGPLDDESNQESETPQAILFEAKWSDTGRFQILNDESGHLGMAVIGTIGKDDPRAVGGLIERSFVDTYRNLLPNESVPPRLAALEARRATVVPSTDRAPVVKLDPIDTTLPAASGDFLDTACEDFMHSCSYHKWVHCSINTPLVTNFIESIIICPASNDWSFFWNMTNSNGSHAFSGVSGSGFLAPANSWGYHDWWSGYPCSRPHLWTPVGGELGITAHQQRPLPCAQGEISE